tara:strand:- start:605 stop:730 length:126 start_codon:yes stop_codon:yes gene_type:complete
MIVALRARPPVGFFFQPQGSISLFIFADAITLNTLLAGYKK